MTLIAQQKNLPSRAGIGLKFRHIDQFLRETPDIGFVEVHAENYMVDGGIRLAQLEAVREEYPLSIHGVAASLGSESDLDLEHLRRLKRLVDRYQPETFSEHLAWSTHAGVYYNDLLPLIYTQERLQRVVEHIDQLQNHLGRSILLENPSTYVSFEASDIAETDFITEVVQRSGCGLLLDVNNIYVSCVNQGWNLQEYMCSLPLDAVGEVHLAGYTEELDAEGKRVLIDSHSAEVADVVWQLYQRLLELIGPQPTLLERDGALPELSVLLAEARGAEVLMHPETQTKQVRYAV